MRRPTPPTAGQAWFCIIAALIAPTVSIIRDVAGNSATEVAKAETYAETRQDIRDLRQQLAGCKPPASRDP
jgi:hypothetical protein